MNAQEIAARNCDWCGASYKPNAYNLARGRGRFCSKPCARRNATECSKEKVCPPTDDEFVAALWERVDRRGDDECWPWAGSARINKDGRGILNFRGRRELAPRVAFMAGHGRRLAEHEFACHSCDNPPCCNPAHIWAGSAADNLRDAAKKGRIHGQQKTACPLGHPYNGIYKSGPRAGGRYCKTCNDLRRAKRLAVRQIIQGERP
jgi:hypothetical protein